MILKFLGLLGLVCLAITSDSIYLKAVLVIVIVCFTFWISTHGKSRGEYIWKLLWDEYNENAYLEKGAIKTMIAIDKKGFKTNIIETERGLLVERTWLPEIIKVNRESGPIILIPWADIHEARILPLRGKSLSYVLMFKLKKKYDVKVYWNTDRLKYCSSERLNKNI